MHLLNEVMSNLVHIGRARSDKVTPIFTQHQHLPLSEVEKRTSQWKGRAA